MINQCKIIIAVAALLFLTTPMPASAFCFEEAGQTYNISPELLWAIAKVESDFRPDAINKNTNGSYDYGVMQINSWWYSKLGKERWESLGDACVNVQTGAWILAQCIAQHGYNWEAVGYYNARTPEKRKAYVKKIQAAVKQAQKAPKRKESPPSTYAQSIKEISVREIMDMI